MATILVAEEIAERGIEVLRSAGHEVRISLGLTPEELIASVYDVNAIIIRSATQITASVLSAAPNLVVVGRAGIGLDNVDVAAATAAGVMVVNAPQSNIISAAEHTMALMLSLARSIPQAHESLSGGTWARSKFEGVELYGKTLGIVGLGRIGALVAQRALSFGMTLVAFDPYISQERASKMGVELLGLADLMARADFVTIHLPKSPETMGLINKEILSHARPGIRIINAARGGIIDETALAEALSDGRVGGAALDVFEKEPPLGSPLLGLANVVVTPHLGASTEEAQNKAGVTIAEQVQLALANEFVPFAVNVNAAEASPVIKPFLPLAESLGRFLSSLVAGLPSVLEIEYQGDIAHEDTRLLTLSVVKGVFSAGINEPVSYVNASQVAAERGLEIREIHALKSINYRNTVMVRSPEHSVGGTLAGASGIEARIVFIDGHWVEMPPAPNMLVVRNFDQPGIVGLVGSLLGDAGYSISSMAVSPRVDDGTALMLLSVDRPIAPEVVDHLGAGVGVIYAKVVGCGLS
ncbi:MAG: phosphoglycerate dehydrogenase [Ferrimicrobium sp.]